MIMIYDGGEPLRHVLICKINVQRKSRSRHAERGAVSGGMGGSYERTFTLGLVYFYTVRIFTSNFSCIIDTD